MPIIFIFKLMYFNFGFSEINNLISCVSISGIFKTVSEMKIRLQPINDNFVFNFSILIISQKVSLHDDYIHYSNRQSKTTNRLGHIR